MEKNTVRNVKTARLIYVLSDEKLFVIKRIQFVLLLIQSNSKFHYILDKYLSSIYVIGNFSLSTMYLGFIVVQLLVNLPS